MLSESHRWDAAVAETAQARRGNLEDSREGSVWDQQGVRHLLDHWVEGRSAAGYRVGRDLSWGDTVGACRIQVFKALGWVRSPSSDSSTGGIGPRVGVSRCLTTRGGGYVIGI